VRRFVFISHHFLLSRNNLHNSPWDLPIYNSSPSRRLASSRFSSHRFHLSTCSLSKCCHPTNKARLPPPAPRLHPRASKRAHTLDHKAQEERRARPGRAPRARVRASEEQGSMGTKRRRQQHHGRWVVPRVGESGILLQNSSSFFII
jgi:hypothetical protein